MLKNLAICIMLILLAVACGQSDNQQKQSKDTGGYDMVLKLTSTAFEEGGMIPARFTCDGEDVSPSLSWSETPERTKSFALICDDPDTPMGTWIHWVLYNLPPDVTELAEAIPSSDPLESGARQGVTSFGRPGYGGPCPPSGTHRYFFKLYALDTVLNLEKTATSQDLLEAMKGHILAAGQLMGRYKRL
ncbi:MAG: YbhB/YbcL family Raf kinase inhibitor-like protein [Candidatus Zixiibacteriota bacterium]